MAKEKKYITSFVSPSKYDGCYSFSLDNYTIEKLEEAIAFAKAMPDKQLLFLNINQKKELKPGEKATHYICYTVPDGAAAPQQKVFTEDDIPF